MPYLNMLYLVPYRYAYESCEQRSARFRLRFVVSYVFVSASWNIYLYVYIYYIIYVLIYINI